MYKKYSVFCYGLPIQALLKIAVIMKLTLGILFFTILQVNAKPTYAQHVTVRLKSAGFSEVFKSIIKQTGYEFLYSPDDFKDYQKLDIEAADRPFTEVLDEVLKNKPFSYRIDDHVVVIEKTDRHLPPVKGRVTDEKGQPLDAVTVKVKGTATVTITNERGEFTINVPSPESVLVFSAIGFTAKEVKATTQPLRVMLQTEVANLGEVVVIGYGTTTRKQVTGAVDQIKSAQIADRPVANVTQALQGASPSLAIQQRSMNPNDNTLNINVRGISTMNNNSPLIVIDGLITDGASLNNLNPSDIQSVSVLKDAGTSAIYGSRSANGVILVTTKKGAKNQKPVFHIGTQTGAQDPKVLFSPVQGYQNATLKNLALTNVGSDPEFTYAQIKDLYDHRNEEKWYNDQILQTALQQNYNLSVSGGSENSTYLFSGAYFDQNSNFVGDNYGVARFNLRSNLTTEYGPFKFTSILAYVRNNTKATTATNAIINSTRIAPYYYNKMQADNGKYLINDELTDQNPLAELRDGGYINYDNDYVNINLGVDANIIKGLKLRGLFGADIYSDHRYTRRIQVPLYSSADAEKPIVYVNPTRNTEDYNGKSYLLNYQLLLDYDRTFGKHHLTGLFGATNESNTIRHNELKYKYTDPILGIPTTGSVVDVENNASYNTPFSTTETSISSLLGRAGYSYADKYYGEVSFRYDGSSKFPKDVRWGFFPSASLGWRISEESFMNGYKNSVGDLKIRGSYGVLGNQNIDAYQYITTYSAYSNIYGFNNSSVAGAGFQFGNPDLKWESTHTINIGADASFFKNALTATFDYFHKNTEDILITPETPTVFGTTLNSTNAGKMKNQGWEVTLNYHLKTGVWDHNIGANLGDSWNKVTKITGDEQISTSDYISKIIRVGLPFNAYYGYKTNGYFQSMEEIETSPLPVGINATDLKPGDVKYLDRNNDGVIDSKDRYVLGNAFPRYTFGLTYNLKFKGFDFGMFWQGVGKRDMMVRGELVEPFHENYSYVIYKHQLDFWTPTNTEARWPRLTATGSTSRQNNFQMGSDLYRFDGSYARLKNIQVGYTLPPQMTGKIGLQKVHVYVNAQNILTLSANSWIDPESSEFDSNMSGAANSARNYPTLRYYGVGVDVDF